MLSVMRSQAFQKFTKLFVPRRRIPLFPLVLFHANLEAENQHERFEMKHQFMLNPNLWLLQSAGAEAEVEFLGMRKRQCMQLDSTSVKGRVS